MRPVARRVAHVAAATARFIVMPPEAGSILPSYIDRSIPAAQPKCGSARPQLSRDPPTVRLIAVIRRGADAFHLHGAVACHGIDSRIEVLRNAESDPAVSSGDSPVALHGTAVSSIDTHRTVARSHRQFLQSAANLNRSVTGVGVHAARDVVNLNGSVAGVGLHLSVHARRDNASIPGVHVDRAR